MKLAEQLRNEIIQETLQEEINMLRDCAKEYQKRLREKHAVIRELCDQNVEMGKTINELKRKVEVLEETENGRSPKRLRKSSN